MGESLLSRPSVLQSPVFLVLSFVMARGQTLFSPHPLFLPPFHTRTLPACSLHTPAWKMEKRTLSSFLSFLIGPNTCCLPPCLHDGIFCSPSFFDHESLIFVLAGEKREKKKFSSTGIGGYATTNIHPTKGDAYTQFPTWGEERDINVGFHKEGGGRGKAFVKLLEGTLALDPSRHVTMQPCKDRITREGRHL